MKEPSQRHRMRGRPGPAARPLAAIALGAALALGGCGGGDADAGRRPDRTPEPALPQDTATEAPPAATVDTAADRAGVTGAPDTGSPEWSTETRTRQGTRPSAELVSARTAAHDGYDRLVLEFRDRLPGYTIGYVGSELHQCGSGRPVEVEAPYALIVELSPAAAHDEQGNATGTRSLAPGLPVLRVARIICDFEGVVEWVVQTERRAPLRVLTLEGPARLVIDLRTTPGGD